MPYKLVKRYYWCWLDYMLQIRFNRVDNDIKRFSQYLVDGHRPVYVYISVKGSRVCKPCNVLAVRTYVRASMV